jgi:hypothetical protein
MHREVLRVVFGHVYRPWLDSPYPAERLTAEEVTVTEFISEPLPRRIMTLADYPWMPAGESTEQRYLRLLAKASFEARVSWAGRDRDDATGGGP